MSIAIARNLWNRDGIARLRNFMPRERCAAWCETFDRLVIDGTLKRRVYETPADPAILNEGGMFDHYILDGFGVGRTMPDMLGAYEATRVVIAEVTGLDAITSPYPRSAVNVNRYDAPGGQMSAHFDSNPISVLLYLTDNPIEGGTEFFPAGRAKHVEYPVAGDLLIFKGRDIRHQSAPLRQATKVAAVWNFYTQQDQSRPAGMDDFMYEFEHASPGDLA